jgi:hypothetical protein
MEMQGTVSKATIMEVSEIAKALLPVRGNSSSRLITNGQPVVNSSSSQEAEASSDNLSSGVQSAINFTTNALNSVAGPSESVSPDDFSMVGRLQNQINIAASNAQSIYHNGGMTQEELTVTLEAMYGAQANLEAIYHFITFNYNAMEDGTAEVEGYPSNRRGACWRCFWRAVARVAVAIVVTAVIVAIPVAAMAAAKGLALFGKVSVMSSIKTSLVKGVLIQELKVTAALASGFAAGIKNAAQNWNFGWKGIAEWKFGVKLTPIAYH